ncbi:hypothetical protein YPD27_2964 [Yersinia pestis KIM D27]|nr:hypothetical protein YPD27_2964 [Yersinia pestis KIM D27]EIS01862.1 hypothetical protein YPPY48_3791 [Yersinia pestis PY-48]
MFRAQQNPTFLAWGHHYNAQFLCFAHSKNPTLWAWGYQYNV